ncbi:sialate O-acetylesterase [Kitasatospora sp. NPDC052896]|uniref:sialate O-acetylesterase n=1 Tax=Kitasatospora sp. NPDC052896 TaxID=3364061 RepID=UPI0037C72777
MPRRSARRRALFRGSAGLLASLAVPFCTAGPALAAQPATGAATVRLTQAPAAHQLYPRDPATNSATVRISGQVEQGDATAVRLDVARDGQQLSSTTVPVDGSGRTFSFSPEIQAGPHGYSFSLYSVGSATTLQDSWPDVVAGDVYLVNGQSNSTARQRYDMTVANSSAGDQSPWVRTFGSSTGDPTASTRDDTWQEAQGDGYQASGVVGQYAVRLGERIVTTYGVPVAILTGGQEAMPISFFQPTSGDHADANSNYGRLLDRTARAGVRNQVRGILWYQGESDNDNVAAQTSGFDSLVSAWKSDYPGLQHIYPHQIRNGCQLPSGAEQPSYQERDAQREFGDIPGVTVLSTTGVGNQGPDNCHYYYHGGYQTLADHDFATVAHDFYGGSSVASTPPNPLKAWFSNADHSQITIALRNTTDHLNMPCGPTADFIVNGSSATVTSVAAAPGEIALRLSGPATGATGISYVGHDGAGPWITNDNGTGLLAFYDLPFAADHLDAFPAAAPNCLPEPGSTARTVAGDLDGDGILDTGTSPPR